MADMNTFFHEATLRICGSLEIETVAKDCLAYLKPIFYSKTEKTGVW